MTRGLAFGSADPEGKDAKQGRPSGGEVKRASVLPLLGLLPAVAAALSACADTSDPPRSIAGADPAAGLAAMRRHGCGACHAIPGLDWPRGVSGPALRGFADRPLLAGRFSNRPDVLVRFITDAPAMAPDTAMPSIPLTHEETRDMAAYLYTLHD